MALKELDSTPELRDDPSLKDFNDVTSLAKSLIETKKYVGSSIRPPGPDASPEAKADFYKKLQTHAPDLVPLKEGDAEAEKLVWGKLGRPADKAGYDFKPPDGVAIDLDALKERAVEGGWTKAQFQKAATREVADAQKRSDATKADRDALKTKWGNAYEAKLQNAAAAASKLNVPKEVVAVILKGEVPSASLEMWDSIGTAIGKESKIPGGAPQTPLTPVELDARFTEIQAHPAYFNKNHPEHEAYVRKAQEVAKQLAPEA